MLLRQHWLTEGTFQCSKPVTICSSSLQHTVRTPWIVTFGISRFSSVNSWSRDFGRCWPDIEIFGARLAAAAVLLTSSWDNIGVTMDGIVLVTMLWTPAAFGVFVTMISALRDNMSRCGGGGSGVRVEVMTSGFGCVATDRASHDGKLLTRSRDIESSGTTASPQSSTASLHSCVTSHYMCRVICGMANTINIKQQAADAHQAVINLTTNLCHWLRHSSQTQLEINPRYKYHQIVRHPRWFLQRTKWINYFTTLHTWRPGFSHHSRQVWNSLPDDITTATSLVTLWRKLKTFFISSIIWQCWLVTTG